MGQIAAWEEKTDERIHSTNVARIFGQLCAQREAGIDCRRRALAAKLLEESQLLQLELVKTEVSQKLHAFSMPQHPSCCGLMTVTAESIIQAIWWIEAPVHMPLILCNSCSPVIMHAG